jgi:hypothetical protein
VATGAAMMVADWLMSFIPILFLWRVNAAS